MADLQVDIVWRAIATALHDQSKCEMNARTAEIEGNLKERASLLAKAEAIGDDLDRLRWFFEDHPSSARSTFEWFLQAMKADGFSDDEAALAALELSSGFALVALKMGRGTDDPIRTGPPYGDLFDLIERSRRGEEVADDSFSEHVQTHSAPTVRPTEPAPETVDVAESTLGDSGYACRGGCEAFRSNYQSHFFDLQSKRHERPTRAQLAERFHVDERTVARWLAGCPDPQTKLPRHQRLPWPPPPPTGVVAAK